MGVKILFIIGFMRFIFGNIFVNWVRLDDMIIRLIEKFINFGEGESGFFLVYFVIELL